MKNRIDLNAIPEDFEWTDNQAVVLHENGWFKADMTCDTKSVKVALNRFFKAVPELANWREWMMDGKDIQYKCNDLMMADGTRNPTPSFAWEIDTSNAGGEFPTVYIFLNVNEKIQMN